MRGQRSSRDLLLTALGEVLVRGTHIERCPACRLPAQVWKGHWCCQNPSCELDGNSIRPATPREQARAEHECDRDDVRFVAHYAAPGVGWHGRCIYCGRDWAVVGGEMHDPSEGAHIMDRCEP